MISHIIGALKKNVSFSQFSSEYVATLLLDFFFCRSATCYSNNEYL